MYPAASVPIECMYATSCYKKFMSSICYSFSSNKSLLDSTQFLEYSRQGYLFNAMVIVNPCTCNDNKN